MVDESSARQRLVDYIAHEESRVVFFREGLRYHEAELERARSLLIDLDSAPPVRAPTVIERIVRLLRTQ